MELKITEVKRVEVPLEDASVEQIVDLFDTFMDNIFQKVPAYKYEEVLKGIGDWVDKARDGYSIPR